jgi:hypothetical protein
MDRAAGGRGAAQRRTDRPGNGEAEGALAFGFEVRSRAGGI